MLRGLIIISLGFHIFAFLHIADIYENRAMSYIELSMLQTSRPDIREIPKPRIRRKPPGTVKVKTVQEKPIHVPRIKIEPVTAYEPPLHDQEISLPELPGSVDVQDFSVPDLIVQPQTTGGELQDGHIEFTSAQEYFEMLNLRIHSTRKYPDSAKSRHHEGRVTIQFVLSDDGSLSDIKILKRSRHRKLNEAAVDAVKNASPFPRPPPYLFKTPVTMEISILFELA